MVEWKKLGDIMSIVRGASPRPIKNYITNDPDGISWIKIGDVSPNAKYITTTAEKITREGAAKSRHLNVGDFIVSNSMSFGRPYILKTDGCIHDGWIAMSDFEKIISSGYLYEVLNSELVQKYWKKKANDGGAMSNLNSDIVRGTIIPIPSLTEQERIVGILDTFTASIDNLKEQIARRRKQFEFYRDQLLDLEGKEGVEMKVSDFCLLKAGKGISASEIKDLKEDDSYSCFGGNGKRGYVTFYSHEGNFPIIGRQGALCGCVAWASGKFYATEHAIVVSGKENTNQRFLFYLFQQANLNQYKSQGAQPGLSVAKLNELLFRIPPLCPSRSASFPSSILLRQASRT